MSKMVPILRKKRKGPLIKEGTMIRRKSSKGGIEISTRRKKKVIFRKAIAV